MLSLRRWSSPPDVVRVWRAFSPLAPRLQARQKSGSTSGSTKRYLRRQQTDPYGRQRQSGSDEPSYVARSAHKLLQLDKKYRLFRDTDGLCVVDLGAAPGGWTQVAAQALARDPTAKSSLLACDLLPLSSEVVASMPPQLHFGFVQGDFTSPAIQAQVLDLVKASRSNRMLVLSDMMPPVSGIEVRDSQASLDVCLAASAFAENVVAQSAQSTLVVMKHMQGSSTDELRRYLAGRWRSVEWSKPQASRSESREGYLVLCDSTAGAKAPQG